MKATTEEWLRFAKDDLEVAEKILDIEHLTNMIAFHSHQAVEKCFKAIIEEHELSFQRIHNLHTLLETVRDVVSLKLDKEDLRELNEVYISTRYPADMGLMPYGKPGMEDAVKFYTFAKNFYIDVQNILFKAKIE